MRAVRLLERVTGRPSVVAARTAAAWRPRLARALSAEAADLLATPRERVEYDALIVGGGPAGLSAAIRLKQKAAAAGQDVSVCVIEKGHEIGAHILSGNVFEPRSLNELIPDWKERGAPVRPRAAARVRRAIWWAASGAPDKSPPRLARALTVATAPSSYLRLARTRRDWPLRTQLTRVATHASPLAPSNLGRSSPRPPRRTTSTCSPRVRDAHRAAAG